MKKLITSIAVVLSTTCFIGNSYGIIVSETPLKLDNLDIVLDQGKGKPEKSQSPKNQESKAQEQKKSSNTKNDQQPAKKETKQEAPARNNQEKNHSKSHQSSKPQKGEPQKGHKDKGFSKKREIQKGDQKNGVKGNRADNRFDKRPPSNYKGNKGKKYDFKHPYKYGSPGVWYPYGDNQGFYYGRNYGQWRAAQARNKHNKFRPRYEYEAIGVYTILVDRNVYLVRQTDHKIIFLRSRLLERRNAGLITVVAYDDHLRRVGVLEKRRSNVELSLNMYI